MTELSIEDAIRITNEATLSSGPAMWMENNDVPPDTMKYIVSLADEAYQILLAWGYNSEHALMNVVCNTFVIGWECAKQVANTKGEV